MKGYLPVPRDDFFAQLWAEKKSFEFPDAYLDLQQIAAYAPTSRVIQNKFISLKVGEFVASERYLEKRWSWSRTKVRNFIATLKKNNLIDHRKDQGETVRILLSYWSERDWKTNKKPPIEPPTAPKEDRGETKVEEEKRNNEEVVTRPPISEKVFNPNTNYETAKNIIDALADWQKPRWLDNDERALYNSGALEYILDLTEEDIDTIHRYSKSPAPTPKGHYILMTRGLAISNLDELLQKATQWAKSNTPTDTGNRKYLIQSTENKSKDEPF